MYNKYYELRVSIYLLQNIHKNDVYEKIATLINYSFNNSQLLSDLHKAKGFKHYSFSGLYPIEMEGVYLQDEVYSFMIRTYKQDVVKELKKSLNQIQNDTFNVIDLQLKEYNNKNIKYIDNLTPTIITINSIRWNKEVNTLEEMENALFNNLNKKYNSLHGIGQIFSIKDIIEKIEIKSKCGIITNYKGIKWVGYKFRIYFKDNNLAQDFANLAVTEGIGEKNSSFGQGFVKPYFR